MATVIKILCLFLQVWSFSWMLLLFLHSILNTGRGQFKSYFIVLFVIVHLSSFPALEHCWSTDWSRILKKSEIHKSLQSICQRKVSLPLWCHKGPQSSSPLEVSHGRENCFLFITSYFCRQYFFRQKYHLQKTTRDRQILINSHFLTCHYTHLLPKLYYFLTENTKKAKRKRTGQ